MRLIEFSDLETWMIVYFAVLVFILGAVFGSFLNCAAWRIVRKMDFVKSRSICPKCQHVLGILDLIPIVNYFIGKGRCRYCGEKISPRYPITEFLFGTAALVMFFQNGISVLFLRNFVFGIHPNFN